MPVQIDMDMPKDFIKCRFYSHNEPKTKRIYCNADTVYHSFKAYGCRCDNCPLKEVK